MNSDSGWSPRRWLPPLGPGSGPGCWGLGRLLAGRPGHSLVARPRGAPGGVQGGGAVRQGAVQRQRSGCDEQPETVARTDRRRTRTRRSECDLRVSAPSHCRLPVQGSSCHVARRGSRITMPNRRRARESCQWHWNNECHWQDSLARRRQARSSTPLPGRGPDHSKLFIHLHDLPYF